MFLILLIYAIYPKTLTLLVVQTAAIALGAVPLFAITKERLGKEGGVVIVALYFLYPALWGINLWDWHPVAFSIPFLIGAFYFFSKRNYKLYAISIALALSCKETVAFPVIFLGIYGIRKHRSSLPSLGDLSKSKDAIVSLTTVLIGLGWIALSFTIPGLPHYSILSSYYGYLGGSIGEIISSSVSNPGLILGHLFRFESFRYYIFLLGPIAFLPLLSPDIFGIAALSSLWIL